MVRVALKTRARMLYAAAPRWARPSRPRTGSPRSSCSRGDSGGCFSRTPAGGPARPSPTNWASARTRSRPTCTLPAAGSASPLRSKPSTWSWAARARSRACQRRLMPRRVLAARRRGREAGQRAGARRPDLLRTRPGEGPTAVRPSRSRSAARRPAAPHRRSHPLGRCPGFGASLRCRRARRADDGHRVGRLDRY